MGPKVSVIVPVYNTEQWLPRCVESILSQSQVDLELLLIDDGSKDKSGVICDEYAEKDKRVRVWHKENGGVSSARNVGLDHARGEWVTFVDSDDFIEADYLSIPFEDGKDLYVRNWAFEDGSVAEYLNPIVVKEEQFKEYLQEHIHMDVFREVCSSFFRRSLIEENKIRFHTQFRLGEDTLFALSYIGYADSLEVVDGSTYRYNRPENWNTKYKLEWEEAEEYLATLKKVCDALPVSSPRLLAFMLNFIHGKIKDEGDLWRKWALSKTVAGFQGVQLLDRGLTYRMKYYGKAVLARVMRWMGVK